MRELSARLAAVLAFVPPCDVLVDVGCDHAYLPLAALAAGRVKRAIAIDRCAAPLAAAERHRQAAGLEDRLELRLGDGLTPLGAEGADALTIAGVGGRLAVRILGRGPLPFSRLVVQPNQQAEAVRAWAYASGWHLIAEEMVEEEGRVFPVLAFAPAAGPDPAYAASGLPLRTLFAVGPHLVARAHPVAVAEWKRQQARLARLRRGDGVWDEALAWALFNAGRLLHTERKRKDAAMIEQTHPSIDAYVARIKPDYEAALREAVEIPSVSTDPAHAADVRRMADWAMAFLKRHGIKAELFETAGYPVVVGEIRHPEARRTLTIYNHLDVQPANEPEWTSEPFSFVKEGDTYRGRGTTDDKGPALAAFYAALEARDRGVPLNLRFIWECEEEIGSPHFDAFLAEHAKDLATDSVVVSDTIWIARGKPAAPLGLRGMATFRLTLETGTKDVHSGLAGGAARNPIAELCQLITDMVDARTGRVKIPGIYEKVRPVTEDEIKGFVASGFDTEEFKRAHGLKCLRMTAPEELTQAIWARPTFEVHGIVGGYTGPGVKAIVPPRAEAKLSMRLVPDLRPEEVMAQVKAFVAEKNPDVQFHEGGKLEPFMGSAEGAYADAVKDSLRFAFGADPAFVREGGSIGAVVTMQQHLGCPITFIGLSLPEHGYHAPNENFDWEMASGGIKAFSRYFDLVAAM